MAQPAHEAKAHSVQCTALGGPSMCSRGAQMMWQPFGGWLAIIDLITIVSLFAYHINTKHQIVVLDPGHGTLAHRATTLQQHAHHVLCASPLATTHQYRHPMPSNCRMAWHPSSGHWWAPPSPTGGLTTQASISQLIQKFKFDFYFCNVLTSRRIFAALLSTLLSHSSITLCTSVDVTSKS